MRRAATTQAKRQVTATEYELLKSQNLWQISSMIAVHKIPPDLVINWDQLRLRLLLLHLRTGPWLRKDHGA